MIICLWCYCKYLHQDINIRKNLKFLKIQIKIKIIFILLIWDKRQVQLDVWYKDIGIDILLMNRLFDVMKGILE